MRSFAKLYAELDRTTSLNDKQAALVAYLRSVEPGDGAWAVALLSGRRPKKPITSRELKAAAIAYVHTSDWMLDESYELVGDLSETIALLIDTLRPTPSRSEGDVPLAVWMEERLPSLIRMSSEEKTQQLICWWDQLSRVEIFLLQKLMTGSFRVGVSQSLVTKALAATAALPIAVVTQRLTGHWTPNAAYFHKLLSPVAADAADKLDQTQPYPFALAYPLDTPPDSLGTISEWAMEWKWDGIRAQLIRRGDDCYLWSRGEDLITATFPELVAAALQHLPAGTVLDGEILAFGAAQPLPFAALQKRLGRKKATPAVQAATPVQFLAYDLLEAGGVDLREAPYRERRQRLTELMAALPHPLGLSPLLAPASWEEAAAGRLTSRAKGVEGLMLKRFDAPYRAGRRRGDWWKWKVDPLTIDAVLLYAQAGSGKRANLYTDYTLAVWDDGKLVPVAKAYSGLDQQEIAVLDRWIRAHTKEKFGPVRSVEPVQVFEVGFEAIQVSSRHKAGIALRFPRLLRWRQDKTAADADSLATVKALLDAP